MMELTKTVLPPSSESEGVQKSVGLEDIGLENFCGFTKGQ